MHSHKLLILLYGTVFVIGPVAYVCSGYLSGKRHLFSALNAVMAGLVFFIGFSSIAFALQASGVQWPYANYTDADVYRMIGSVSIFVTTMLLTYHFGSVPRGLELHFSKRPRSTHLQPLVISVLAFGIALMCMLPRFDIDIPVISNIMARCLAAAVIFAALFSFSSWWRDRGNVIALVLFAGIFSSCIVLATLTGGGRRCLLGVIISIAVFAYWKTTHHMGRAKILQACFVFLLFGFLVLNSYNQVRHLSRGQQRNVSTMLSTLSEIPMRMLDTDSFDVKFFSDVGQNATNVSLYSIHLSDRMHHESKRTGLKYPSYFHTLVFTLVNPVPRQLWPDKPLSLGYMLPKQYQRNWVVNWGPGLAGHFYHEGGLLMAIFYGCLIGWFLRCCDAILAANPDNLYLIGLISSMLPQLVLIPRGDMAIALLNLVFCFVVFYVTRFLSMKLYGRALRASDQSWQSPAVA